MYENGKVDWALNDAQTWTVIGVLAATLVSSMALIATLFTRTLKSEIGGLRTELRAESGAIRAEMAAGFRAVDARFKTVDRRFEEIDRRFEQVDRRFDTMNHRMDGLDRDIRFMFSKLFGTDTDQA